MKKVNETAIDVLQPFYTHFSNQISDISLVNCLIWNAKYHFHYVTIDDNIILINIKGEKHYFSMPIPDGVRIKALPALVESLKKQFGLPLHFKKLTHQEAETMSQMFEGHIIAPNRDESDYLYDFTALKYLKGKKYHKKKNHVNQFHKYYPDFKFNTYEDSDYPAVEALLTVWCEDKNGNLDPNLQIEKEGILKLLKMASEVGVKIGLLWVASDLVGLIIGEVINGDTLLIHIEKANTAYEGVYTALSYHFYNLYEESEIALINREQDLGIEGLRKSKESYHPIALLDKYEFIVL